MRAAMYAEMAKTVTGQRPPHARRDDEWDVALEAAILFIESCGLGERPSRQLLSEASATKQAARDDAWDAAADETCMRLAVAFRQQIRYG